MEPPNNGHVWDECFVHYSEVVPSLEVLTCIQLLAGGTQFVHCREVVRSSDYRRFHCIHSTIYNQHGSHNITGDVMGSVGPPIQYQKHLYTHNTNSVGSRAWDSVVDGFESLVSLAEQAWLTPAQLISVIILTRTWMLCRRIEDGSHSMNQGVQGKCITNTQSQHKTVSVFHYVLYRMMHTENVHTYIQYTIH